MLCYIFLCYGGGFGTMPSYVLDVFGSKVMAVVYGTILTAWSMAGIVGPQVFAYIADNYKADAAKYSFIASACFLCFGFLISLILRKESKS